MVRGIKHSTEQAQGPIQKDLDLLWSKYRSGWKRLLSTKAIAELQLRASFELVEIKAWRIANKVPTGTIPDCPNCQNICCAGLENVVSLRLVDIARLIDSERTELISVKKPNFPLHMLQERPLLRELVASMLFRALPILKQEGELRACAALTKDLKCGLHPQWPTSCERFPYSLSVAQKQVVWGRRCQSRQQGRENRERQNELFKAAIQAYNERVKDAILITHAKSELDELGIGKYLTAEDQDPFEPKPKLPIIT